MPRFTTLLSLLTLVGVSVLFFLVAGQRLAERNLRAMILSDRATAALQANDPLKAEELLTQVGALNPETPNLWTRRALARMSLGQYEEAVVAAMEELKDKPTDINTIGLLGAAQILSDDPDAGDETLTVGHQIDPSNRPIVQNLSELRRMQQRPAEAAEILDGYLTENPSDMFFQFKRAMADVAGDLPDHRRADVVSYLKTGRATAGVYVIGCAIDLRDGKPEEARLKLAQASKIASPQDMQKMMEDIFFREHITALQLGGDVPQTEDPPLPLVTPSS